MLPILDSRLTRHLGIALLAGGLMIAPVSPAVAQIPAPAVPAAAAGSEAAVQQALARMQYVGGVIQNFPIATTYYSAAPCYPLASSELALLARWETEFQSADTAFQTALGAYQTNWTNRTGAAGRALLAGAKPPSNYQAQASRLRIRTNTAAEKARATIKNRTKACTVKEPVG